jgi:hypothetical protein
MTLQFWRVVLFPLIPLHFLARRGKKRKKKRKSPMSLTSWQELADYVEMVMQANPSLSIEPRFRGLLMDMLWVTIRGKDFQISIDDIVDIMKRHGLHKQKAHLKRQLLFLREGIDFKVTRGPREKKRGGSSPEQILLTVEAFRRICIRAHTPVRHLLEHYFLSIEQHYRQNALQLIQERRAIENPLITIAKRQMQHQSFAFGPCVYVSGLFDEKGEMIHLKDGWCHDMNTRLPELQYMYSPFYVKILFHLLTDNTPLAVEQCGFNTTPLELRSPFDQEIVDMTPEEAIQSLLECDRFLTSMKQKHQIHFNKTHEDISKSHRFWLTAPTITEKSSSSLLH